jgi:membrane-associated phospholipid phosphatase
MAKKSSTDKKKAKTERPPEQELGDTPVAPWEMPTPEEKAEVKPVRQALREALAEVDSPEKAEQVIEHLTQAVGDQKITEVKEPPPPTPAAAAEQVKAVADIAPSGEKAESVLAETARVIASTEGHEREVVAQAAQEVLNPEQQGATAAPQEQEREYLRRALLKKLKPVDAIDAELFLRINHLPHTQRSNRFFYFLTYIFTGGVAWFVFMGLLWIVNRRLGWRIIRESALSLALATALVEYPIKSYFRRRRPFIAIVQAIVIGKKPGTWSFPSGHSATAFAGAYFLSRYLPRLRGFFYAVASLVAFSRVYLGDHYPGDVVSGSTIGVLLARLFHRLPWPWKVP